MGHNHGGKDYDNDCYDCHSEASRGAANTENSDRNSDRQKSASNCFIATAVYGNKMAPQVVTLRGFRDNVLKKSYLGRKFVTVYYKVSPPIATWLKGQPLLAWCVKKVLNGITSLM